MFVLAAIFGISIVLSPLCTTLLFRELGGWLGGFLNRRWSVPPKVRRYEECFKMLARTTDLGLTVDLRQPSCLFPILVLPLVFGIGVPFEPALPLNYLSVGEFFEALFFGHLPQPEKCCKVPLFPVALGS